MKITVAIGPSSFSEVDKTPYNLLESYDIKIKENPYKRRLTENEIIDHIRSADGLIAGLEPLNKKVLSEAKQLKAIARVGIGMDNVDLVAAEKLSIKVSNTPDAPTISVAELTIAALLTIQRKLIVLNDNMHSGDWTKIISPGLYGKTMLIIGYGRIGRKVSELAQPFGVNILIYDPLIDKKDVSADEQFIDFEEGLEQADIISLHASGNKIILDEHAFSLIRKTVIILNSARGELINENALISSLESGKVSSGWFDTFTTEPYHGQLLNYEQILLTPHVGTYTESCRREMEIQAVYNLLKDLGLHR